ncbi:hypothetical protein A5844_000532, partial [Enterococcus sp. 10A9_DIV0425]
YNIYIITRLYKFLSFFHFFQYV